MSISFSRQSLHFFLKCEKNLQIHNFGIGLNPLELETKIKCSELEQKIISMCVCVRFLIKIENFLFLTLNFIELIPVKCS